MMQAEIQHLSDDKAPDWPASPVRWARRSSNQYRLLGENKAVDVSKDQDPRPLLMDWMRRRDNPYFAKAIVNRVWAHYLGRGIIDPPDNLSPLNPASHPELLKELCDGFIQNKFDLKWLHRTILASRTYQQSSEASSANSVDRGNYAYFYYRRLPAEVLLDTLNQSTGTSESLDMKFNHWPENLKAVEMPFMPKNEFIKFMLEQFGRPARNSSAQCDCERDPSISILQVMSLANHPRVRQKIEDPKGQVARIAKDIGDDKTRIEELFLCTLSRLPNDGERQACAKYLNGHRRIGGERVARRDVGVVEYARVFVAALTQPTNIRFRRLRRRVFRVNPDEREAASGDQITGSTARRCTHIPLLRRPCRGFLSQEPLHNVQRSVNARSHPSGADDLAAVDESLSRHNFALRSGRFEIVRRPNDEWWLR